MLDKVTMHTKGVYVHRCLLLCPIVIESTIQTKRPSAAQSLFAFHEVQIDDAIVDLLFKSLCLYLDRSCHTFQILILCVFRFPAVTR